VAVAMNANQGANFLVSGSSPERTGNAHPNLAPYEVFQASDGYFILAVGNDEQFVRLCQLIGRPDLAQDPRFNTNASRLANLPALRAVLATAFVDAPREQWGSRLQAEGISWGTVNSLDEVFGDEQVVHRRMLRTAHHPAYGDMPVVRNPMLSDPDARAAVVNPVPRLGEHTQEVLATLSAP
jgi:crotonobetainyl-CoA:carnitine CoA-transferase CaiB-like acyl-CoA transferase